MKIGVPKEIKIHEYRVGMTPETVKEAIKNGHTVFIEKDAGSSIGFSNELYEKAGGIILDNAAEIFEKSDMIVKVKEPQSIERKMLKSNQILFTYLHLAADIEQTKDLIESGVTAIAYETVTDNMGGLPLLKPMSAVAGSMSIQVAAHHLEKAQGGSGILMGGVAGVLPAKVVVLGAGVVGSHAIKVAIGMGADVTVLDKNLLILDNIANMYGNRIKTLYSTHSVLENIIKEADVVIGGVLIPGASAPKLITKNMLSLMKKSSVLVDVAIDQGGCFETSKATTHTNPTYVVDGIIHYCVANMPGAVARTSTIALTNATLPFLLSLANKGFKKAVEDDIHLKQGLNVHEGKIYHEGVSNSLGYKLYKI